MTPERFVELFQAAITLEGSGDPFRWAARSPLVRAKGSFQPQEDRELWCYGPTAGAAIEKLAAAAALAALQGAADARAAAEAAELRLRRMMAKTEASLDVNLFAVGLPVAPAAAAGPNLRGEGSD